MSNNEIGTLSTDFLFLGTYISKKLSKSHLSLIETLNTTARCYCISQTPDEYNIEFLLETLKQVSLCLVGEANRFMASAKNNNINELNQQNDDVRFNDCFIKIMNDLLSTSAYSALVFFMRKSVSNQSHFWVETLRLRKKENVPRRKHYYFFFSFLMISSACWAVISDVDLIL